MTQSDGPMAVEKKNGPNFVQIDQNDNRACT